LKSPEPKTLDDWSPDSRYIVYRTGANTNTIYSLPLFGDRKPIKGVESEFNNAKSLQMVKQGEGETAYGGVASALLSHGLGSYGIVVVYFRAKGLEPPNANPIGRGDDAASRR